MKILKLLIFLFLLTTSLTGWAQSGNIGIGTTNPQELLHVAGNSRVDSTLTADSIILSHLRFSTGADFGKVLVSDSFGNASWTFLSLSGIHNTLDEAYDQGGAGAGRTITADAGAVTINGSGANIGLEVTNSMLNTALKVTHTGAADGIEILHTGAGNGLEITNSTDGKGILLTQNADQHGINVLLDNTKDGISILQDGGGNGIYTNGNSGYAILSQIDSSETGQAGLFRILGTASDNPALEAFTEGTASTSHGILGRTGPLTWPGYPTTPGNDTLPTSGVVGFASSLLKANGVSGMSLTRQGVFGRTAKGHGFTAGPSKFVAGVFGTGQDLANVTVSDPGSYMGVAGVVPRGLGIVGLADEGGIGVTGICGPEAAGNTSAPAVWGVTKELSTWAAHIAAWPLSDTSASKGQVGVLGQTKERVAVWGESLESIGMVATTGDKNRFDKLPVKKIGIYAKATQTDGIAGMFDQFGAADEPAVWITGKSMTETFRVDNRGTGVGIRLTVSDTAAGFLNDSVALRVITDGFGSGGHFTLSRGSNPEPGILAETYGTGNAGFFLAKNKGSHSATLFGLSEGLGPAAVFIMGNDSILTADTSAVYVETAGRGNGESIRVINPANGNKGLDVIHYGEGIAGSFKVENPGSGAAVVVGSTIGVGPVASFSSLENPGNIFPTLKVDNKAKGSAGKFTIEDTATTMLNPNIALDVSTNGKGSAGKFSIFNGMTGPEANTEPAIEVSTTGLGHAGFFYATNPDNSEPAVNILHHGEGSGLKIETDKSTNGTYALIVEHGGFGGGPASGAVAHFNLPSATNASSNAVLVSSASVLPGHAALKVTSSGLPTIPKILAGEFVGNVDVTGDLDVGGYFDAGAVSAFVKLFRIDHPLDPENKYLQHTSIESNEMTNIYSGNVVLNSEGDAEVELPEWFSALNKEFRYQLTCIGGFANVFISQEVQENRFRIGGGSPGLKVSWQLTGIRKDAYAESFRVQTEVDKNEFDRGTFLSPESYGQPEEKGTRYKREHYLDKK